MPGAVPTSVGQLLRAWRERCTDFRSAREVSTALGVTPAALSQWENDARPPGADIVARLDTLFGAGGCLSDLAAAMATPATLPPRREWQHNFPPPEGSSGWIWVRPTRSEEMSLSLGPFTMRHHVPAEGCVYTVTGTITNPAAAVLLPTPGWADFGRGDVPAALGLPIVNAADGAAFRDDSEPIIKVIARQFLTAMPRQEVPEHLASLAPGLSRLDPQAVEDFLGPPQDYTAVLPDPVTSSTEAEPALDLALLRKARGYSRAKASEAITGMLPRHPVSADQIESLERGHRPRVPLLFPRLDLLYRLDGYLGPEPVPTRPHRSARTLVFEVPPFWVGPIWFRFLGPADTTAPASIVIRPWAKRLVVRSGSVATCRASVPSSPPFLVTFAPGWSVRVGIGRVEGAADINANWSLSHPKDAAVLVPHYLGVALRALGSPPR